MERQSGWERCRRVVDVGCGSGAALYYLAGRFPEKEFIGAEVDEHLVAQGNDLLQARGSSARIVQSDLFALPDDAPEDLRDCDAVLSLQTLSWMPGLYEPLERMLSLRPKFSAHSSLFYEGPVSCEIRVTEHIVGETFFYNVYSLDELRKFLEQRDGRLTFEAFEIDLDLPKPDDKRMRTYTVRTEAGKRLQLSGPLLMPWYFTAMEFMIS